MDPDTRTIHAFLIATEPVRDALGDFVRRLNKRSEVKLVKTFHPEMFPSADLGVSAVLHNGAVVDFWIEFDLRSEDTPWEINYSVERHDPDEDGAHTELNFPAETIHSISALPKALLAAIDRLQEASATDVFYR